MGFRPHIGKTRDQRHYACINFWGRGSSLAPGGYTAWRTLTGRRKAPRVRSGVIFAPVSDTLPVLRGRLHQHTIWFSLAAAVLLVAFAPAGTARTTAVIYGVGLNAL